MRRTSLQLAGSALILFMVAVAGCGGHWSPRTAPVLSWIPPEYHEHARGYADRAQTVQVRLSHLEKLSELLSDDAVKASAARFVAAGIDQEPAALQEVVAGLLKPRHGRQAQDALEWLASNASTTNVRYHALWSLDELPAKRRSRLSRYFGIGASHVLSPFVMLRGAPRELTAPGLPEQLTISEQRARFVAIGDFGSEERSENDLQEIVAARIAREHQSSGRPFDFGITLGDNFYPWGLGGDAETNASRFRRDWERPYGRLGILFYAALGNHDWYGTWRSLRSQLNYQTPTGASTWRMPGAFYDFRAGPVHLVAIDTYLWLASEDARAAQTTWLREALTRHAKRADPPWVIVYGHHPMRTGGAGHGTGKKSLFSRSREDGEIKELRETLLPILRLHGVAAYLAGHDHDMQAIELDGIAQAVAGSSSKTNTTVDSVPAPGISRYCAPSLGFLSIDATRASLTLTFHEVEPGRDGTIDRVCQVTRADRGFALSCDAGCGVGR